MPVPDAAQCARHPDALAVEVCGRCGAFVCDQCLQLGDDEVRCPACWERLMERASTRSLVALVLSVIGVFYVTLLPGVVGLVLAQQELKAIARGEAPESGRTMAKVARVLGALSALGLLLFVLLVVLVLTVGRVLPT